MKSTFSTLSIIIPAYNERATIEELIARVVAVETGLLREIIIVDDGSTDGSRELYSKIKERFAGENLRIHLQPANRGKGAAVRTGFSLSTGDIVLIQDADLECDPADYPRLLKPILDGRADVVYGSRFLGTSDHRVDSFRHAMGNKALTVMSNLFTNLNLTDMETCYKVFRGDIARSLQLRSDTFTIEPEMTAKVARGKWRIHEVAVHYAGRDYAEGKKIRALDGFKALWAIVRFRFFD